MSFTTTSDRMTDRWTDVYLTSLARGVSTCGDFLAATALVLTLQGRGSGGFAVAALLIAAAAPPTLLAPWTGRLADRVDSRRLLLVVSLAQAVICAILAYARPAALLIALVALLGCGLAVINPTINALIPEMVGPGRLVKATAVGQTATSIALLIA